jgi:hypothetical protein
MNLIQPEMKPESLKLSVGDILVDSDIGVYMLRETRDGKYMFRPLSGHDGGYNGIHDTLSSITERTIVNLREHNTSRRNCIIYKANEWDLKLVPKGSN